MKGILYGIGVGPGDPELLTLKAVRIISECDILVVPGKCCQDSVAYQIASAAVPTIKNKQIETLVMPMTRDQRILNCYHQQAAEQLLGWLQRGKRVGMLNLGDITLYATYTYISSRIQQAGYQTVAVNGITSFCAAAAVAGIDLVSGSEQLHVLSTDGDLESDLRLPGTKVIMKSGTKMADTIKIIKDCGLDGIVVERCGMPDQQIYLTIDQVPETVSYYALVIVKESAHE